MMMSGIQVIVWDFDGTFYRLNERMWEDILDAQYRVIMDHTGWTREKTVEEHRKVYKVLTQSGTDTVARLLGIPIARAVLETEKYYDRTKFISFDAKLVDLFQKLTGYRHLMLVNGKQGQEEKAIDKLGIPRSTFETWITPESTGSVKPDFRQFQAVLNYTCLPPMVHLVIGDRESVDLVPAHQLGMKTCLVWSDIPGRIADETVPSVYDVAALFT
jgi:FMN phosphatase YigB (HAD superfamily)